MSAIVLRWNNVEWVKYSLVKDILKTVCLILHFSLTMPIVRLLFYHKVHIIMGRFGNFTYTGNLQRVLWIRESHQSLQFWRLSRANTKWSNRFISANYSYQTTEACQFLNSRWATTTPSSVRHVFSLIHISLPPFGEIFYFQTLAHATYCIAWSLPVVMPWQHIENPEEAGNPQSRTSIGSAKKK